MKKALKAVIHGELVEAIESLANRLIVRGYFVTRDEAIEHALYFGIANLRATAEKVERDSNARAQAA
jgi:hypothetical protein